MQFLVMEPVEGGTVADRLTSGAEILMRSLGQIEPISVARGLLRGVFVAPDGQWAGFVDNNRTLKKVAITGGPSLIVTTLDGGSRGATCAAEDTIIFATNNPATGLQRVPAAGGEPTVLTRPNRDRGEADHLWPVRGCGTCRGRRSLA